jgi:AcrR family transcriptional regulator
MRAIQAIVALAFSEGYTHTTVAQITREAGISRTTFYECFKDKEDCFLAAHRQLADALQADVERALAGSDDSQTLARTLTALVDFARREPAAFHLLTHEAMIAGPRALDARDALMLGVEQSVEAAQEAGPDIPVKLVLGGAMRLIGISMRRAGGVPEPELAELTRWLDCYKAPTPQTRWLQLAPIGPVVIAQEPPKRPLAPRPLPRGRHRLSEEVVAGVQHERILHATAEVVCAKGYAASTVADIAAAAGLSREVFYTHLKDKREAFLKAQQLVFEQMIAASAGAFFTASTSWPQRIWEAIRTTTAWLLQQPTLAHFDFIEAYALGPSDAKRVDENVLAFSVFMEEGYRHRPEAAAVPRLFAEAITGSILEFAAFYIRHDRAQETPALLPLLTYVILAPYTGAQAANELVDEFLQNETAE